jgi:hypothetical protein
MGNEILAPKDKAPNAGKIVHRSFTDIWRKERGTWRLALRQATVAKLNEGQAGVSALPQSRLLMLTGQSHSAMFEAPKMLAEMIIGYLSEH